MLRASAIDLWFGPFIEGPLAFIALLFAFALRRRKRFLAPTGFVLIALGLIADAVVRSIPMIAWTRFGQAAALTFVLWGIVHIAVDVYQRVAIRGRAYFSTAVAEAVRATLYLAMPVLVLRLMLHFDFAVLGILSTIPAGGALIGWLLRSDFFRGLVLQSQRSFRPGDWLQVDGQVGQVQWTGWRATRLTTRANQSLQIPNSMLSQHLVTNYSATRTVADEILIGLGYEEPPGRVEEIILGLLKDIPELLKEPPALVEPCEYGESTVRYRIRYWLPTFALQDRVRAQIIRSLWYALRRNSIVLPGAGYPDAGGEVQTGVEAESAASQQMLAELRPFYLLRELSEDELKMLIPDVRVLQFGRGEILIREGAIGDSFYILRRGEVEVLERDGAGLKSVRRIADQSDDNFFGEIALLTGEPRTTTIRAVCDTDVLEVNRRGFARLFKARPEAAKAIAEIAAARMSQTRERAAAPRTAPISGSRLLAKMREILDF